MQKVIRYIYLLLKNTFFISVTSLLLVWFLSEDSSIGNVFGSLAFYGTMFGVFIFIIHVVALALSFIFKNISSIKKYIYLLLENVFVVSVISLLIAWLGGEESSVGNIFSGIAFYGTLLCIYLFFAHVVALILSLILDKNSNEPQ